MRRYAFRDEGRYYRNMRKVLYFRLYNYETCYFFFLNNVFFKNRKLYQDNYVNDIAFA